MIYVTGDLHGDFERLKQREIRRLRRGDTLIVCGDFGFLWDGSRQEQKLLRRLGHRRYRILFLEGTHDNLGLLSGYPVSEFCGGQARHICGNLYHLVRGSIFTIEGKRIFAFGGGESPDSDRREEGRTWWPAELPTLEELSHAVDRLAAADNAVDYVVTHDCAGRIKQFLDMNTLQDLNHLNTFLDGVAANVSFKRWFFGCYHLDKVIPPAHTAVYRAVVPME